MGGGGVDYPEMNIVVQFALYTGIMDGITLLLAGGGAFGEGFIRGWTQGAVARMASVLLVAQVPIPGHLLGWAVCFLALFAPLIGGLWRSAHSR